MQNASGPPGLYEHLLAISFLLFLKSLQLYAELGKCMNTNPIFIRQAKIQTCLKNIIATVETCGNGIKHLPVPPPGAELADRRFRDLGREIFDFTSDLKRLAISPDGEERIQIAIDVQDRTEMIKEHFRASIYGFENIYPGRLAQVLQSHKQTLID